MDETKRPIEYLAEALKDRRARKRAKLALRRETFCGMLAHRPMAKAMPREPREGATHEENQRYEDRVAPFVAWQEAFDEKVKAMRASAKYPERDASKAYRKRMRAERHARTLAKARARRALGITRGEVR